MTPAIENDSGNIAFCVKVGSGEHIGQLLTNLALVLTKGSGKQLGAAARLLLFHRQPRPAEENFQRKNHRRVRTDFLYLRSESRHRANASENAHSFEPVAARDAHSVEEPPIAQRDVRDQARRAMELIVSVAPWRVEIESDVLCGPTAIRHYHRSRLYSVGLAVLRIHYRDCFRVPRF